MPSPAALPARRALATTLFAACWLAGCGFGTAGITAAARGGGASSAATTIGGLRLLAPETSPARIRFTLADPESDAAAVDLLFTLPTAPGIERLATQVDGLVPALATSPTGVEHEVAWRFQDEPGLPRDGALLENVTLIARVRGGTTERLTVRLGNDAPALEIVEVVLPTPPAQQEVEGIAAVRIRVRDSSDDAVDVRARYVLDGSTVPQLAHFAGRGAGEPEDPAFTAAPAPRTGTEYTFFWDTDRDLPELERTVRLQFTVTDRAGAAQTVESAPFRVDNNAAPTIQLGDGALLASPDDGRGIAIPYTVFDDEGDAVHTVFQWRLASDPDFPPLGTTDPAELARLLADPDFLGARHVCVPFPAYARGAVTAVDATRVRLPELLTHEAHALGNGGLRFRDLDLMRPVHFAGAAADWPANALQQPFAAVPLGDGLTALALDGQGFTARVLEVELATGAVLRTLAAGLPGAPSALAVDARQQRALAAVTTGADFAVFDVDLRAGIVTQVASSADGGPGAPLRSILPRGTGRAFATALDAVWQIDWTRGAAQIAPIRAGLGTPWGLADDPRLPGRVLVAERDADRIVSYDPANGDLAHASGTAVLPRPTAIAIAHTGRALRLVALCDGAAPATRDVIALDLGRNDAAFALGSLPVTAPTLATGPFDLVVAPLPDARDLLLRGGIEQRRTVDAFDTGTAMATVSRAFAPAPRPGQEWRMRLGSGPFDATAGSPQGTRSVFVWDSRRQLQGSFAIKATAVDSEIGGTAETSAPRAIANLERGRVATSTGEHFRPPAVADVDGDGALDLVHTTVTFVSATITSSTVSIHLQGSSRAFAPPIELVPQGEAGLVLATDLDGDGRCDLVCPTLIGPFSARVAAIELFFQEPGLTFTPVVLSSSALGLPGGRIAAIDGDRDGLMDLFGSGFALRQIAPRSFVSLTSEGERIAPEDLDGDGDLDAIVADLPTRTLVVQLQESGVLAPHESLAAPAASDFVVADLDGDSRPDIAAVGERTLELFFQGPQGSFANDRVPATIPGRSNLGKILVVDIDGDADLDLLCADNDATTVLLQEGPRGFRTGHPIELPAELFDAPAAVADIDGDGHADICDLTSDSVDVRYGDRRIAFEAAPAVIAGPGVLTPLDLDRDGRPDLVVAGGISQPLTTLTQVAPRSFSPVADPTALLTIPTSLLAADLDGDGAPDLVGTDFQGRVRLAFGNAAGAFDDPIEFAVGAEPRSAEAVDLDGDGDLDFVVADGTGHALLPFYQEAPRDFVQAARIDLPFGILTAVATADLDQDGSLDLVAADEFNNVLHVLLQTAPRVFTAQPALTGLANPTAVVAADLDRDGRCEIVCANTGGSSLTVFRQVSPLVFAASAPIPTGARPTALVATDLDGDGDLDLACADSAAGDVRVFLQHTPTVFRAGPVLPTETTSTSPSFPAQLSAVDFDRDGDVDLACLGPNGHLFLFFAR